jgi:hypothetical protein
MALHSLRRTMPILILLAPTFVASGALAQAYLDARNLSEAAGMLRAQVVGAETLQDLCVHSYPDLANTVSDALTKWRNDDQRFIVASAKLVEEMVRKSGQDPTPAFDAGYRKKTEQQFSSLGNEAQRAYCQRFSADLAARAWRSRTPTVYRLLDEYAKVP